ncbi:MAG: hypothetical protein ACYS5V_13640 [Planctomycetota bacterium]|jgi:hypothetical protein
MPSTEWTDGLIELALSVVLAGWFCAAMIGLLRKAGYRCWPGWLVSLVILAGTVLSNLAADVSTSRFLFLTAAVVAIGTICVMALSRWPLQRELAAMRVRNGEATDEQAYEYLTDACALEREHRYEEAMRAYESVTDSFSGRPPGEDAMKYIQALREKMDPGAESST